MIVTYVSNMWVTKAIEQGKQYKCGLSCLKFALLKKNCNRSVRADISLASSSVAVEAGIGLAGLASVMVVVE